MDLTGLAGNAGEKEGSDGKEEGSDEKRKESNGEEEGSGKGKAIVISGDGDRIQQRCNNSDVEDIAINCMIDELLNMSGQEGSSVTKEGCVTEKVPSSSELFPLRLETLGRELFPMTGPNKERVKKLLKETGYNLTVTPHQRLYNGPPSKQNGSQPGPGCQVFVGRIPKQLFEDTLVPIFAACGTILSMRLMMEGSTALSLSRGYGFVVYTTPEEAQNAQKMLDEFEILKGHPLKVAVSEPFCRLFLGNIPKLKTREELYTFLSSTLDGVMDVITYSPSDDPTWNPGFQSPRFQNRGFCFVDFDTHAHASVAKKKFIRGSLKVFGCKVVADWADPQEEPDKETMSSVKVVYVRGLTREVTENDILSAFSSFGPVERVKKLKDYAFVHFNDRKDALKSIEELNGTLILSAKIEATLAKPPIDRHTRERILKNRERRLFSMAQSAAQSTAKHINQLAFDQRRRLTVLDANVIICGPKVTVLLKDR